MATVRAVLEVDTLAAQRAAMVGLAAAMAADLRAAMEVDLKEAMAVATVAVTEAVDPVEAMEAVVALLPIGWVARVGGTHLKDATTLTNTMEVSSVSWNIQITTPRKRLR